MSQPSTIALQSEALIEKMKRNTGRQCGSCSMCCKLIRIEATESPAGKWCKHCNVPHGCGIYKDRPDECRGFACLWLANSNIRDMWQPQRAKMVLNLHASDTARFGMPNLIVHVEPAYPERWRCEPYYSDIKRMAYLGLNGDSLIKDPLQATLRYVTLIQIGDRCAWLVLPKEDVADPEYLTIAPVGDEGDWKAIRHKDRAETLKFKDMHEKTRAAIDEIRVKQPKLFKMMQQEASVQLAALKAKSAAPGQHAPFPSR